MSVTAVMDVGSGTSLLLIARLFKPASLPEALKKKGLCSTAHFFYKKANLPQTRPALVLRCPAGAGVKNSHRKFADIKEDRIYWTKLAQGYGHTDSPAITPEAFHRQETFFKQARALIKQYNVDRIQCVATEAVRKAQNRESFLKLAEKYGFKVRVLSGKEESRGTALGALWGLKDFNSPPVVLDIGGASTELGQNTGTQGFCIRKGADRSPERGAGRPEDQRAFGQSWPLGSVVLTEQYISSFSPPPRGAFQSLCRHIQKVLHSRVCKTPYPFKGSLWTGKPPVPPASFSLVATAGTATTLACLEYQTEEPYKVHGGTLSFQQIQLWRKKLFSLSERERKALTGMPPQRANLILAGVSVLENVMCFFGWRECVISVTGLRFGLLSKKL